PVDIAFGDLSNINNLMVGMTFKAGVTSNGIEAGQFEILQLTNITLTLTPNGGQPTPLGTNGPVLDDAQKGTVEYEGFLVPIGNNANQTETADDTPGYSLVDSLISHAVWGESLQTYLMYQPNGGSWVPLRKLEWSVSAIASFVNAQWSKVDVSMPAAVV